MNPFSCSKLIAVTAICFGITLEVNADSLDLAKANQLQARAKEMVHPSVLDSAISLLDSAAHIFKKAGLWEKFMDCQKETGTKFYYLSNLGSAIERFKSGLEVAENHNVEISAIAADMTNDLGMCYLATRDLGEALLHLEKSLDMRIKIFGAEAPELAESYNNIGLCYGNMKEHEKMIAHLEKALKIWKKHLGDSNPNIALVYSNLAFGYGKTSDSEKEMEYLFKTLEIRKKLYGESHYVVADAYNNIGVAYSTQNDFQTAIIYLEKAKELKLAFLGKKHRQVGATLHNLGSCYERIGAHDKALQHFQDALISTVFDFNKTDFKENPDLQFVNSKLLLLRILNAKAATIAKSEILAENEEGNLSFALKTYELSIDLIDDMRLAFLAQSSKEKLAANSISIFEGAIDAANRLWKISGESKYLSRAFAIAEKSKSFLLSQAINELEAKAFAGIPDTLVEVERLLKEAISDEEKLLYGARKKQDSSAIVFARQKLIATLKKHREMLQNLEDDFPSYFDLKYRQNVTNIVDVQRNLQAGKTAVIEYFFGVEKLFCFLITKKQSRLFSTSKIEDLDSTISGFRRSLKRSNFSKGQQLFTRNSHLLYQYLFQKIDSTLQMLEADIENIIVIPDGILGFVPFEVLLTKPIESAKKNYAELPYLIKDYAVHYAFSTTFLKKDENEKNEKLRLISIAPDFANSKNPGKNEPDQNELYKLQNANVETQFLSARFQGLSLLGDDASESNFKKYAGEFGVIHLATHALVNDENPKLSKLILTSDSSSGNDGDLHVSELLNLKLSAELVVMSACNTGVGKIVGGEGIMSLARGFGFAGCPSMLMSLWNANDHSTAQIMTDFYEQLSLGNDRTRALRTAKLNYLENTTQNVKRHPYFWAGFVLIGDASPLQIAQKNSLSTFKIVAALSFGFGLILFLRIIFKAKSNSRK